MTHLIDKDALVAEIERRIKEIDEIGTYLSPKGVLTNLLCYLDTLEVKEVDLEKETDKWYDNESSKEFENVLYSDIEKCAKHFFELGLNKNLTWQDIKDIAEIGNDFLNSEESDNLDDEAYYTEILNRFKSKKEETL